MDFVNEGKLDEERKRRQAEWERVRKPEDPVEAPEEFFDNRTLYERLKEQHDKKKTEFESQFALKNRIRGVDSEEAQFLSEVDRARVKREREIQMEEKKEIDEVKKAVVSKTSITASAMPSITISLPAHKKENKQAELLSSVVKTKRKCAPTSASTLLTSTDTSFTKITKSDDEDSREDIGNSSFDLNISYTSKKLRTESSETTAVSIHPRTQIIAGVLPGIGDYDTDSSNLSENTSDEENDEDNDELNTSDLLSRNSK